MFNRRKKKAQGKPGQTPRAPSKLKNSLLSLEQRLMFDAAAAATASEVASEQVAQEQAEAAVSSDGTAGGQTADQRESQDLLQAIASYSPGESTTEIAFVDPTVPDYQQMIAGMGPNVEVVVLDGTRDGMEQIAESLAGRTGIDAIHLISHGDPGQLNLGTGTLTQASMAGEYADELATIKQSLSEAADILVYGCEFAEGQAGQDAATLLSQLTGADVAASTDATGYAEFGGDWVLETQTGTIETTLAVTDDVQANWKGLLAETWMNANTGAVIAGPAGNDWYVGDSANNTPTAAGGGADIMYGAGGDDTLQGGSGNDILVGGTGNDTIYGNSDDDVILGGTGNDYLDGGSAVGKNTIIGGGGNDQMVGGSGADVFRFTGAQSGDAYTVNGGGATDIIDLSEFSTATITNSGGVITVDRGGGDVFTISHSNVETIITAATVGNHGPLADAGTDQTVSTSTTVTLTAVGSSDRDGNTLTYQWTQIEGPKVTLSSSTAVSPTFTAPSSATTLQFVVVVSDGTTSHADTVTINVGAANSMPTITSNGGGASTTVSVTENTTTVTTVTATDANAGQTLSYSIVGGADAAKFTINSSTGSLSFATTPNYESPSDSGGNNIYDVTVQVSDGAGGTDTQAVSVTVTNANETPTGLSLSANTVAENASNGTVVGTVSGTDPDSGDTKTYSLTDTAGGRFAINSSTGVITVADGSLLNYESATSHSVTVRVTDSGGLTYDEISTINLANIDEAPVAADDRAGLTFDGVDDFVDMGSGVVYEVTDTMTMEAWINREPSSQATQIIINKEGEYEVGLDSDGSLKWAFANTIPGWAWHDTGVVIPVHTWTHIAVTYDHGTITSYVNGVAVETFAGSGTIGDAHPTKDSLRIGGRENNPANQYFNGQISEVQVWNIARTAGEIAGDLNGTLTGSETGLLGYWKFNENTGTTADNLTAGSDGALGGGVPGQTPQWATYRVNEDTTLMVSGSGVLGNDYDTDGDTLSAIMVAGPSHASAFTLNSDGSFSYTPAANFSGTDSFTYRLSDGTNLSNVATVHIQVDPVNDAPIDLTLSANTVAENAANGTVVGTVSGADPDSSDTKTYSLTDTAGGRFAINSSTGQITVADGSLLNYENATSHSGTVRVTDSGGLTYDESFTINLTNVNEAPTGADATITISEDTSHTLTTANFGFSEVDAGDNLSAVRIDTVPNAGTLTLSGVAVTASQVITVAGIIAGNLVFTPAADANGTGYATLTFSVRDSNNAYDAAPNALTFDVTAVNDAPVLSVNEGATVDEGGSIILSAKNLEVVDIDNGASQVLYTITSLPINGTILLKGTPLSVNDTFTQADIDSGIVEYQHDGSETDSDSFALVVDDGAGGSLSESTFKIAVTPVNEAPTDLSLSVNTVAENATNGTVVGTVSGTDPDSGDTKSYSLTDTAGGRFAIDSSTGVITVADGTLLNYESAMSHSVTVRVTDSGGQTYDETFTINLANVNETPTDLSLSANTVAENAANGTVVGTVSGTDPDRGDTKTYSFTDSAGGRFAINNSTGQIAVANSSLLNYESATSHTVIVRVTDSGGLTYDETFTINLTNVNEAPTGADATVTISEDTSHPLTTMNFGFSDVDAGDSLSAVRIDTVPSAGTLTLSGVNVTAGQVIAVADIMAGNLVFTPATDANGIGYATLTFSVRDNNSLYDSAPNTLTFDVTAVNDAPVVTPIAPDVTFVEGGMPQVIDATGTINDVDSINFDAGVMTVSISANGTIDDRLMVGNWGTGPGQVGVSGSDVTYGGTVIGTVSGGISGSDPLVITFNTSATASTVQEVYRSIQFNNVSDNPSTATRTLTIGLTDGDGGTATPQAKLVYVQASNDAPTDLTLSANTVAENAANGAVVGTVSGTDPDSGDTKTYSLTDTAGGRFAINASTGEITVADGSLLNYESATSHSVTVWVTDSGGLTYDETFTINLTDANETPTDLSLSANTVAENVANGTVVGTVSTTDLDAGDSHTYQLTDSAGGRFAINSATGVITVADGTLLDYEATTSHAITVRTTDAGGLTSDRTFTINLTNMNEAPTLSTNTGSTVAEEGTDTITASELAVTDADSDAAQLTYSIGTGPAYGRLELTTAPGVSATTFTQTDIAANQLIYVHDGSETTSDSFTFTVSDGAGGSLEATTVTLTITPVNDTPTITSNGGGSTAAINVAENVSAVTIVTGADVDLPAQTLTYSIDDGSDQALFTINATTGTLHFTAPPDFEVATDANGDNIYVVQVRVTDSQGATTTQTIQVSVTDVVEEVLPTSTAPLIPPVLLPTTPTKPTGQDPVPSGPSSLSAPPTDALPPSLVPLSARSMPSDFQPANAASLSTTSHDARPVFIPENLRKPIDVGRDRSGFIPNDDAGRPAFTVLPAEPAPELDPEPGEKPQSTSALLLAKLNEMAVSLEETLEGSEEHDVLVTRIAALAGTTLSAGFIVWALRSGALLASVMATMPAWRHFDPLPVLGGTRSEWERRRRDGERDQRAEASQFRGIKNVLDRQAPFKS